MKPKVSKGYHCARGSCLSKQFAGLEPLEGRRMLAVTTSVSADGKFLTLQNDVIAFKIARTEPTSGYSRGDITSIVIKATNKELLQPGQRLFLEIGAADDTSANASGVTSTTTSYFTPFSADDSPVFNMTTSVGTGATWGAVKLYRRTGASLAMVANQYFILRDGEYGLHAMTSFMGQGPNAERLDFVRLRMNMRDDLFREWSVEDHRSGTFPTSAEFASAQWSDPAYKESPVLLPNGTYYSKYETAAYYHDTDATGLLGADATHRYSAFFVYSNQEANTGGYNHHELMVHPTTYGPIVLGMLHARHYGAPGIALAPNERRVFPPTYLAFNYGPKATTTLEGLRDQAEAMVPALEETNNGFYKTVMAAFADTTSYLPLESATRGRFSGRFINADNRSMANTTLILGDPNTDSQLTNNGYQYYARTDSNGVFDIKNIRPGTYRLTIQQDGEYGEYRIENFVVTANTTIGGSPTHANTWFVRHSGLFEYVGGAISYAGTFSYGGSNYGDFGTDVLSLGTVDRSAKEFRFGDTRDNEDFQNTNPKTYLYRLPLISQNIRTTFPQGLRVNQTSIEKDLPLAHWAAIGNIVPVAPYDQITPTNTTETYELDIGLNFSVRPSSALTATVSLAFAATDTSQLRMQLIDATGTIKQNIVIRPMTYDPLLGDIVRRSSAAFRQGASGISSIGTLTNGQPVQFNASNFSAGANTLRITLEGSTARESRVVMYDALKVEINASASDSNFDNIPDTQQIRVAPTPRRFQDWVAAPQLSRVFADTPIRLTLQGAQTALDETTLFESTRTGMTIANLAVARPSPNGLSGR